MELKDQKRKLIEYILRSHWVEPVAITSTFKKMIHVGGGVAFLSKEACVQNLRHVLNKVNYRLWGRRFKSGSVFGPRLKVVPVLEQDTSERFHYHMLIDADAPRGPVEFRKLLEDSWRSSRWGHREIDIQPVYDLTGWTNYLLKARGKKDLLDALDWENLHMGDRQA